jgi:long-chain acyl-CoA synthetase
VNKPWLDRYPEGVPAEIDLNEYSSILDIFEQSCEKFRTQTAYLNFGKELSFDDLDRLSRDFAAFLQGKGLKKGDRIAVMLPNILQYPVVIFGAMRAGLVVVNTNPMYTARELKHQLTDSGARAIVIVENFASVLEKVIDDVDLDLVVTTRIGDLIGFPKGTLMNFVLKYVKKAIPDFSLTGAVGFDQALKQGARSDLKPVDLGHDDLAFLQYTGGTTGVAKGAMLTHRNLVANMLQARAWMLSAGIGESAEIVVTALPLYHIFALTANCLSFMAMGGVNLLITNPRDMEGFVKELQSVPFTYMPGVNTLFNGLLNTPGFAELDFSTFKGGLGGGMAVQRAVAEHWKEVTGTPLIEAYGLTETSPAACINPMDIEGFNGCIGLPISSTECGIMNDAGELLPQGERGELVVRGPQVMKGYWQRPEATAEVITEDGWLRTGDSGRLTAAGKLIVEGRLDDRIVTGGENVAPDEVEAWLEGVPGVTSAGVFGVPDEAWGQRVTAAIVVEHPGFDVDLLSARLRNELAPHKRPKEIAVLDALPLNRSGKLDRAKLAACCEGRLRRI